VPVLSQTLAVSVLLAGVALVIGAIPGVTLELGSNKATPTTLPTRMLVAVVGASFIAWGVWSLLPHSHHLHISEIELHAQTALFRPCPKELPAFVVLHGKGGPGDARYTVYLAGRTAKPPVPAHLGHDETKSFNAKVAVPNGERGTRTLVAEALYPDSQTTSLPVLFRC
jgi:hypothetical protein